jgi:hypothetical protein
MTDLPRCESGDYRLKEGSLMGLVRSLIHKFMKFPIRILSVISSLYLIAPGAEEDAVKLPRTPWHMVNLHWKNHGEFKNFDTFSVDVEISCDASLEAYQLYIAPLCSTINGDTFYGGIQTHCGGWDAMKAEEQKRQPERPAFIFSRWSEKPDLTLKDVRATPGGFVELAGYEGDFASGRRPYPWKAGKYTYTLQRLDTEMVNGKPFTWLGAFVHEHATGKDVFVSALRFEGETLTHGDENSGFIEFYGDEPPEISKLPALEVCFSNLRYNGAAADLKAVTANFIRQPMNRPDKLDAPISPNIMHVSASEDGRAVTCKLVNKIFPDSEEPDRVLWSEKK